MAISSNRIIGLTQELQIEQSCHVTDLHIGWQNEFATQQQKAPSGRYFRAPVVTWSRDGVTHQYVPTLHFVEARQGFEVDADRLMTDIKRQLLNRDIPSVAA
ncbi:hypothetical protein [Marinobacter zhejiangensis]|uniref:Uncharacterized protein n=1 Tax=Marinobacter zhejiangensis TaxID=488535 RepID=A0A1I4NDB6_9GAMM|nr:hypothetical protein [Marinobacter zhejiangensis]SFM13203.1 hypothetical protein SAMN04487963_1294 [Marinobacter zhejiangensis]